MERLRRQSKAEFFRGRSFYEKLVDSRTILNRRRGFLKQPLLEVVAPQDFERVQAVLNDLLRQGIIGDWVIGGGAATTYYTLAIPSIGIDIFSTYTGGSAFNPFGELYPYLIEKYGAQPQGEMLNVQGLYLQFLPAESSNPVDAEAVRHPRVLDDGLRLFELEYLLCSMLYLGTPKYRIRLQHLKSEAGYDEEKLRPLLRKFGLEEKWEAV